MTTRLLASLCAAVAMAAIAAAPILAHDSASGAPDVTITIGDGLSDRDVRVEVGAIVRFVNRDDDRHRMRSRSGDRGFDTGNLEPGEAYQVRLSAAGTYTYLDDRERDDTDYHGRIRVTRAPTNAATAASPGASATVTIGDRVFEPAETSITVGGTVTFRNVDSDEHTATSTGAAGGIDSGVLSPDATHDETFPEAGTFEFLCAIHPDMRGTIRVVAGTAARASTPPPSATPDQDPTPASSPTPAPSSVTAPTIEPVDIVDLAFEPAALELPAGTAVLWTNTGAAPHTVSAEDGSFDSGTLQPGSTFERTFTTPGTYAYLCQIHPEMTGTIEILAPDPEPPAAAPAAANTNTTSTATTPDTTPTQSALPGVALTVTLVGVASALFARLLRGTANRR
jgi:plastocyanin